MTRLARTPCFANFLPAIRPVRRPWPGGILR